MVIGGGVVEGVFVIVVAMMVERERERQRERQRKLVKYLEHMFVPSQI